MKSSVAAAAVAAVFLAVLCGPAVALSFNGYDKSVMDTLASSNDLSQVKIVSRVPILMYFAVDR